MIVFRPRDQHVWDPRPLPHETKAETKTNYCETETETKKVVSRPRWSRHLNIPAILLVLSMTVNHLSRAGAGHFLGRVEPTTSSSQLW